MANIKKNNINSNKDNSENSNIDNSNLGSSKNLLYLVLSTKKTIKNSIHHLILTKLKKHFNQIYVLCLDKKEIEKNGNIIYYSGNFLSWIKYLLKNIKNIKIIYITDFFIGGLIGTIIGKLIRKPVIFRCGAPWEYTQKNIITSFKKMLVNITKPIVLKSSNKIVYNAKATVIKNVKHNYKVIYNGVDTKLFSTKNKNSYQTESFSKTNKLKLLFIGNFNIEKGIELLAEVVKEKQDLVSLSMVGDGPLYEKFKKDFPFINLYGRVEKAKLPSIIRDHDVFVLPTHVESFPNVLLESMSCGTPIIATSIFGIPEMFTSYKEGILIEPKNKESLTNAIDYFLKHPEKIKEFGLSSRKHVEEKFKSEKRIKELCDYLLS